MFFTFPKAICLLAGPLIPSWPFLSRRCTAQHMVWYRRIHCSPDFSTFSTRPHPDAQQTLLSPTCRKRHTMAPFEATSTAPCVVGTSRYPTLSLYRGRAAMGLVRKCFVLLSILRSPPSARHVILSLPHCLATAGRPTAQRDPTIRKIRYRPPPREARPCTDGEGAP